MFHGYAEAYLQGKWIAMNPAFDVDFCETYGFICTEFDGYNNAFFSSFDKEGRKAIEYIQFFNTFADLPYDFIDKYLKKTYGELDQKKLSQLNGGYYKGWA
jgi:hypothetical protein